MPRLFVALGLPDAIRDALADRQSGLEGARWIEPGDLHVTLRFIGDVSGGDARALDRELDLVRGRPFDLTVSGLEAFGG
ncbi:MAG: 2'-5' RNA ligase family protein, partial [Pseudomonadota bacterium]